AEDRPKIFQIFGRGQGSEVPGEGLGLAFVRTTLERHGGNIDFESTPGEGTTFFFSLPRAQPEDGRG
ncbi:MAG: HAMP domain-containing histidine kinase, partial [Acidobacteria bacterium]|nr:HAMP domain-containing histidine kinase [Acidobacteriota bacterium]